MAQQITQLVTILFLLSMVCERIADFLKHYLCGNELFGIGDTITKFRGNDLKEQARSYRILKINVWCGIITALVLKADLIKIFNKLGDPGSTIGWDKISDYSEVDVGFLIPGIVLTGCFISFGSKFWHDLLDIIYQVKNTRRLMADPELYNADNMDSLQRVISTYQSDFIKAAYTQAKSELMLNDNVRAVSLKKDNNGIYFFELKVKIADPSIGPFYSYTLANGTKQSITIKTVIMMAGDNIIAHTIDLSARIFDMKSPDKWGTFGCLVKPVDPTSAKRYVLTCCHNVVHPVTNAKFVKPGTKRIGTSDHKSNPIGKIFSAERDHEMDVSLIEIDPEKLKEVINSVPELSEPSGMRTLTDNDKGLVNASLFGAASQFKQGIVTSLSGDVKIKYSTDTFQMINLLVIENNGAAISQNGDSGCVVLDDENKILGIVVGGDTKATYVIPIEKMLKKLKVELL